MKTSIQTFLGVALGWLVLAESTLPGSELHRQILNKGGRSAIDAGKYSDAERLYRSAIQEADADGIQDVTLAISIHGRARAFDLLENPKAAEAYYKQSLALHEKLKHGTGPDLAADVILSLAGLYESQGRPEAKLFCELGIKAKSSTLISEQHLALVERVGLGSYPDLLPALATLSANFHVRKADTPVPDVNAPLRDAGRFLCFIREDWENGLPLLAVSGDAELHDVSMAELRPQTRDNPFRVANTWYDLGNDPSHRGEQEAMHRHARQLYQKALPGLEPGLKKILAQRRIAEIAAKDLGIP